MYFVTLVFHRTPVENYVFPRVLCDIFRVQFVTNLPFIYVQFVTQTYIDTYTYPDRMRSRAVENVLLHYDNNGIHP